MSIIKEVNENGGADLWFALRSLGRGQGTGDYGGPYDVLPEN